MTEQRRGREAPRLAKAELTPDEKLSLWELVQHLSEKHRAQLSEAAVIRLALERLAQAEGLQWKVRPFTREKT